MLEKQPCCTGTAAVVAGTSNSTQPWILKIENSTKFEQPYEPIKNIKEANTFLNNPNNDITFNDICGDTNYTLQHYDPYNYVTLDKCQSPEQVPQENIKNEISDLDLTILSQDTLISTTQNNETMDIKFDDYIHQMSQEDASNLNNSCSQNSYSENIFSQNLKKNDNLISTQKDMNDSGINSTFNEYTKDEYSSEDYDVLNDTNYESLFYYGVPKSHLRYIKYKNHIVAYDSRMKIPFWSAECLSKKKLHNKISRQNVPYKRDDDIPTIFSAYDCDYKYSGYSRGHVVPARDMSSKKSLKESFYFTNMIPQCIQNNRGYWQRLENYCRCLLKHYEFVWVISGPLFLPKKENNKQVISYEIIGENKVSVPTHIFKIILAKNDTDCDLGCVVIPNAVISYNAKVDNFVRSLDFIEKWSGFTYFPKIKNAKMLNNLFTKHSKLPTITRRKQPRKMIIGCNWWWTTPTWRGM
ncbi:hypothetical protein A3Q56_01001 [Intoshia linei]|uniref:Endonuclease G, mitochondrial n=1 Tax=Intoshia linei TaxID=1819745 RepID=A0A177BAE4_9BILA|nr:hypothetical protein A3Q56_01001 [Intoshia linei]